MSRTKLSPKCGWLVFYDKKIQAWDGGIDPCYSGGWSRRVESSRLPWATSSDLASKQQMDRDNSAVEYLLSCAQSPQTLSTPKNQAW